MGEWPSQHAPVAEWIRRRTSNPFYAGSNPAGGVPGARSAAWRGTRPPRRASASIHPSRPPAGWAAQRPGGSLRAPTRRRQRRPEPPEGNSGPEPARIPRTRTFEYGNFVDVRRKICRMGPFSPANSTSSATRRPDLQRGTMQRTRIVQLGGGAAGLAALALVAAGALSTGAPEMAASAASVPGLPSLPAGGGCQSTPGLPVSGPVSGSGSGSVTSTAGSGSVSASGSGVTVCATPAVEWSASDPGPAEWWSARRAEPAEWWSARHAEPAGPAERWWPARRAEPAEWWSAGRAEPAGPADRWWSAGHAEPAGPAERWWPAFGPGPAEWWSAGHAEPAGPAERWWPAFGPGPAEWWSAGRAGPAQRVRLGHGARPSRILTRASTPHPDWGHNRGGRIRPLDSEPALSVERSRS